MKLLDKDKLLHLKEYEVLRWTDRKATDWAGIEYTALRRPRAHLITVIVRAQEEVT